MITSSNVADILFRDCAGFNISRYRKGNEKIDPSIERVVIRPQRQQHGDVWRKGFVEVNLCVPDIKGESNTSRLDELEKLAWQLLDTGDVNQYDGTTYTYRIHSTESEIADAETRSHYVNVKLLFQVFQY